jgi:serine protease Do
MSYLSRNINRLVFVVLLSLPLMVQAALPDFTTIVESAKDSVVNISTRTKAKPSSSKEYDLPELPEGSPFGELFEKFFDRDEHERRGREAQSLGSGFIISKDGYILTNHHVIAGADEVIVSMSNRKEYVATIIGSDEASDVAVIKVESDDDLPVLAFGDSDKLKVGEWVLAIGSPFGFDHSVTAGIVSAKGRSLPGDNYVPFIQTDVAIKMAKSSASIHRSIAAPVVSWDCRLRFRSRWRSMSPVKSRKPARFHAVGSGS